MKMDNRFYLIIFPLVLLFLAQGCKRKEAAWHGSSNSTIMRPSPEENSVKDGVNYGYRFEDIEEFNYLGEFQISSLSRTEIKLEEKYNGQPVKAFRDSIYTWFPYYGSYQIEFDDGSKSYFRYSNLYEKGQISFRDIRWISNQPAVKMQGITARISRVEIPFENPGEYSLCTLGDSQIWYYKGQNLRNMIAKEVPGLFSFQGHQRDNYGFPFTGRGVNSTRDLLKIKESIPISDYYLLSIGTYDWRRSAQKVYDDIRELIEFITLRNPDSRIIITSIPNVADTVDRAKDRNDFIDEYNNLLRDAYGVSPDEAVSVLDLSKTFDELAPAPLFRKNGIQYSPRGYTEFVHAFIEHLAGSDHLGAELKKHYRGVFESFDRWPLGGEVIAIGSGNTTAVGEYHMQLKSGRNAIVSELGPTIDVRSPHRAEFSVELEPFYQGDSIWLGFDLYIPSEYEVDEGNEKEEVIVFQIHSKPEEGQDWAYYQKYLPFNTPSIALSLRKDAGEYVIVLWYGLSGKDEFEFKGYKWKVISEAVLEPDVWNKLVFNYKLGFSDDGYIRAWINDHYYTPFNGQDNRVYGANMHNNAKPYMKMGLYRYWEDSHKHQLFYDNLKIAPNKDRFFYLSEEPDVYKDGVNTVLNN